MIKQSYFYEFNLTLVIFTHSLMVKMFYLTTRWDRTRCYHSGPEWTWMQLQWRATAHSPKLQGRSLIIRLFSVISWNLVKGEGITHLQRYSKCILQPQPTGLTLLRFNMLWNLNSFAERFHGILQRGIFYSDGWNIVLWKPYPSYHMPEGISMSTGP